MELSLFLAKAWGLYAVVICLSLLIRKNSLEKILKDFNNEVLIMLSGIIAFGIGLAQVLSHNIWVADWRLFITLFGWAVLLKGLMLLFFPEKILIVSKGISKTGLLQVILTIYLLFGIYLTYVGFLS